MLASLTEFFLKINWIEFLGTLAGILGVWFSIKEKLITWPTFIVSYSAYIYVSLSAGLFAHMSLNILFIFISIYGWRLWLKNKTNQSDADQETIVHKASKKTWILNVFFWLIGSFLIGKYLSKNPNAFMPYLVGFACAASISAQWMLSRKCIGTWLCWLIADSVFLFLYAYQGYVLTVVLFASFMILAVLGWKQWHDLLKSNQDNV